MSELVYKATDLMLRDMVRFTKAPMETNRKREYKVIELYLSDMAEGEGGLTVVQTTGDNRYTYRLTDAQLVELGAEII